jgi:hypothetical protein
MLFEKLVKLNRIIVTTFSLVSMLLIPPCAQAQQYKYETPIPPALPHRTKLTRVWAH